MNSFQACQLIQIKFTSEYLKSPKILRTKAFFYWHNMLLPAFLFSPFIYEGLASFCCFSNKFYDIIIYDLAKTAFYGSVFNGTWWVGLRQSIFINYNICEWRNNLAKTAIYGPVFYISMALGESVFARAYLGSGKLFSSWSRVNAQMRTSLPFPSTLSTLPLNDRVCVAKACPVWDTNSPLTL